MEHGHSSWHGRLWVESINFMSQEEVVIFPGGKARSPGAQEGQRGTPRGWVLVGQSTAAWRLDPQEHTVAQLWGRGLPELRRRAGSPPSVGWEGRCCPRPLSLAAHQLPAVSSQCLPSMHIYVLISFFIRTPVMVDQSPC